MNLVQMEEVRVENHKIMLPVKLKGRESDTERAISFYSTSGKLAAAAKEISAQGRINALATNCNLNHISELNLHTLFGSYADQLFDPSKWKIISFHNQAGARLNQSVTTGDSQILKPVGDHVTDWAANTRRQGDISFVQVRATIDLSSITKDPSSKYSLDTFIELPQEDFLIKDGTGADLTVHTYLGADDIRTIAASDFHQDVLKQTRQRKPATLLAAPFGMTAASLDYSKKDDIFREDLIESNLKWLEDELFVACCPGVSYRPSSALSAVTQIYTDANGNEARLSIHMYFTNIFIAMSCMGNKDYEVDVLHHVVENMDSDIRTEMESTYSAHLGIRARDPLTQTKAVQSLLVAATKAEKKVLATRTLISKQHNKVMTATVPGYTAIPISGDAAVPGMASVAERTIGSNTPIPPFEWKAPMCVCCGSLDHKYTKLKSKDVICPNAGRPGAKENVEKNYAKLRGDAANRRNARKPKWGSMNDAAKRNFAKTLLANDDMKESFNAFIAKAKEDASDEEKPVAKKKNRNVTVLPSIAVFNGRVGGPPILPVTLDGNLPHCGIESGGDDTDNLVTVLVALIDSGAGATIGWLQYWEAVVLINPSILVQIFTCKDGAYSPITMQGIVDNKSGTNQTELPVAFQIRTRYHCRDGSELHMIVGLGMDVSVNFIISNAWMRKIGAVIDYGANEVRVPLLDDVTKFPITFRAPVRTTPGVANHVQQISHNAAFAALPQIEGLLHVMMAYNPRSPWLPTARKLARALSESTVTPLPATIREQSSMTSVLRGGPGSDAIVPYAGQPSHAQVGVQGSGVRVTFAPDPNEIGYGGDVAAGSADGSPSTASQKIAGYLSQDLGGDKHGQALLPSQSADSADEDLFGDSS